MTKRLSPTALERYQRDGLYFPVPVLTPAEARAHHAEVLARSAKILYRGTGIERFAP